MFRRFAPHLRLFPVAAATGALTLALGMAFVAVAPAASSATVEPTTAVASVSTSPVQYGTSVMYTINVSGSPTTPTGGAVSFQVGNTFLCTVPNLDAGTASCSASNAPGRRDGGGRALARPVLDVARRYMEMALTMLFTWTPRPGSDPRLTAVPKLKVPPSVPTIR